MDQPSPTRKEIVPATRSREQPATLLTRPRHAPSGPTTITRLKQVGGRASKVNKRTTRSVVSKVHLDMTSKVSVLPIEEKPEDIMFPRLKQGRNQSLRDYLRVASAMQVNFPPELEAAFVAHFCRGLSSTRDRSKIHEALHAKEQETVSGDGTVAIGCTWQQLLEFMSSAELLKL